MDATHYSLERMNTSATDMLHFLDMLAHGKMVSAAASSDMLHLLLRQRGQRSLAAAAGGRRRGGHKTGKFAGSQRRGPYLQSDEHAGEAALVSETTTRQPRERHCAPCGAAVAYSPSGPQTPLGR